MDYLRQNYVGLILWKNETTHILQITFLKFKGEGGIQRQRGRGSKLGKIEGKYKSKFGPKRGQI